MSARPTLPGFLRAFARTELPPPQEPTGFFTDTTLCIGCKACEVACKQWNQLPGEEPRWWGQSYDHTGHLSATTWRHVSFTEEIGPDGGLRWLFNSDVCKHCSVAPCEEACPTGALIRNEFDNVYVLQDICNGCGYCVAACPFGVIGRSDIDHTAHKCTLCYDRQQSGLVPACAKACPTQSIQFGPVRELRQRARQRLAELHAQGQTSAYLYGADAAGEYSALNAFFLLTEEPAAYNLPPAPRRPMAAMGRRYLWSAIVGLGLSVLAALTFAREERDR